MEGSSSTPNIKNLKNSGTVSASSLFQNRYLPSRFAHERNQKKNCFQDVLNSIESNMKTNQQQKYKIPQPKLISTTSPVLKIKPKQQAIGGASKNKNEIQDFKSKPMKRYQQTNGRQQSDMLNFRQIFIEPRQEVLKKIQQKGKLDNPMLSKQFMRQYEKNLEFENGTNKIPNKKEHIYHGQLEKIQELTQSDMKEYYKQAIIILDQKSNSLMHEQLQGFYDEQIKIEPPDLPNSSIASTLAPGGGYAPSIPLNAGNITKQKANLKELLMRAKAGTNTEDMEKEAHISFFIGAIYQQQKQHQAALKFYRRFISFAKAMEDKIGMSLGANRIATNYFYCGQIQKSINFHNQNLKLSDNQNCFAGFYNLGICYRKLKKYEESIEHFETGLQWAHQKGQMESQCLSYGQLAVTYQEMQLFQQALQNFEKSLEICQKMKKTQLQLYNLRKILAITSQFQLKSKKNLLQIAQQAYECSKLLGQKNLVQIYGCNIGIIQGLQDFQQRKAHHIGNYQQDIQQYEIHESIAHI